MAKEDRQQGKPEGKGQAQSKPEGGWKGGGKSQEVKKDFKQPDKRQIQIVRVAETDLDGGKPVRFAIREIKGVGHMMANAIAHVYPNPDKKVSDLTEEEIAGLEDYVHNPQKYGIPAWLLNRRKDPETGEDRHVAVSVLQLIQSTDINKMKKIRTWKGVRHGLGQPVRGQRTRSSFRSSGKSVGVKRQKEQPAKAGAAQPAAKK